MFTDKIGKFKVQYLNQAEYKLIKDEIFISSIYNIKLKSPSPYIIDIGAHIGLATLYFKLIYPQSQILSIEPNPLVLPILENNVYTNGLDNVEIINKAVDIKSEERDFYISQEDSWYSTASFNPTQWKGNQKRQTLKVKTIDILELINRRIDLIKIDIEGYELEIIKRLESAFHMIDNVIVEYHPTKKNDISFITNALNKHYKKVVTINNDGLTIIKASS